MEDEEETLEKWLAYLREKHEKEDDGPDISAPYY
jgi:hypothetical protein